MHNDPQPIELADHLKNWFQHLHRNPEIAYHETDTTAYLQQALTEAGIAWQPIPGLTGLVADIGSGTPVIALRTDIDALPVQEQTGLPYASERTGMMHACGHDFHMAVTLGAAMLLKAQEDALPGRVRIIFQPAEESSTGSCRVIETGILDDIQLYLGLHTHPSFEPGVLGIKAGPVMAAVDRFHVHLHGVGSHGAEPHKSADPVVAMAAVIQSMQSIISRNIDPFHHTLLSITHAEAGTTWNVIPETAYLEGTVRTLDKEDRRIIHERFHQVLTSTCAAYNVTPEIDWCTCSDAVVNDAGLCRIARDVAAACGLTCVEQEDTMIGEDFAEYLQKAPGLFVRVGTGGGYPLHHPKFHVDMDALEPTARYMVKLALACMMAVRER